MDGSGGGPDPQALDQPMTRGERATLVTRSNLPGPGAAAAKAILHTLDQFAAQRGESWPSLTLIAACAGCGRRTALRALQHLRRLGVIRIAKRAAPAGGWRAGGSSLTWTIDYARLAEMPQAGRRCHHGTNAPTVGATTAPTLVPPWHQRSAAGHPQPTGPPEVANQPADAPLNKQTIREEKTLFAPDRSAPAWIDRFRHDLLRAGVASARVEAIGAAAGGAERLAEILLMAALRRRRLASTAAFIAAAAEHPEWRPSARERRRLATLSTGPACREEQPSPPPCPAASARSPAASSRKPPRQPDRPPPP